MKKRITKHIDNQDYVKVQIVDSDGCELSKFNGIIFEQSKKFILMCDLHDFNYDGIVVIRKADIAEIKRNENEVFFDKIIDSEGIKEQLLANREKLNFSLDTYAEMLNQLKELQISIIVESLYDKNDRFQLGPINKIKNKTLFISYINARGEFDFKPVSSKFKDITFIRIDSPYANNFHKYSVKVE